MKRENLIGFTFRNSRAFIALIEQLIAGLVALTWHSRRTLGQVGATAGAGR
jgi:hypothetical protein